MANPRCSSSAEERRAILVLGMHRSGTSALTRTINLLGAAAPRTLMNANVANERGYWESEPLVALNDAILSTYGRHWHSLSRVRGDMVHAARANGMWQRLRDMIAGEFGEADAIVLKDPRVARLVPLYSDVLQDMGYRILPVLALRNPAEVVQSLSLRDDMRPSRSLGLWIRYTLDAEWYTRSMPRALVPYDALLADWRPVMRSMQGQLGGEWPAVSTAAEAEIDEFLTPSLRHHSLQLPRGTARAAIARLLYASMLKLAADPAKGIGTGMNVAAELNLRMRY